MEIIVSNGKKTEDGLAEFIRPRKTSIVLLLETNYTSFPRRFPFRIKRKNSPVETNRHFNVSIRGTKEREIKYARKGGKNLLPANSR